MAQNSLLPEEKARIKIDRQLTNAGWDIVSGISMFRGARPQSKKH